MRGCEWTYPILNYWRHFCSARHARTLQTTVNALDCVRRSLSIRTSSGCLIQKRNSPTGRCVSRNAQVMTYMPSV